MQDIATELRKYFSEQKLRLSLTDRYAFAGDAGFYYLLPKAVVQPDSVEEIKELFRFANTHRVPLVFRTGGTSLSGQSITDGILVDLSKNWKTVKALNDGAQVKVQPGVIGAHVNHQLRDYETKIGPDPASISAAMMGGILSNNSSGMCCGVTYNSYHTLASIRFILPNGNEYNTAVPEDYSRFLASDAVIAEGISRLQQTILSNETLVQKIKSKYRIKNTVGYSINAFIDYTHSLDVLAHLLIGAEGTLAFIAEAVLNTIPDKQYKSTGLLFFENPVVAAEAIPALKATGAEALELMDRPALRSVEDMAYCPPMVKNLPGEATAILCEFQATHPEELRLMLKAARPVIDGFALLDKMNFTDDPHQQAKWWKMRKGMYPSVAAVRARGTTAMLEDVAVPLENLGNAVTDLQTLFIKYGYTDAIIFGHAKEGNLHFLVTQPVNRKEEIDVFAAFNDELANLIIHKYKGSLKAEHGTGRQIAPYVKDEWGDEGYRIMEQLKELLDPNHVLNPGVIINKDDQCHLKNMKTMPVVEEEVDKCVECGYCENRCPSREYTLTPRQRIQIRRSLQRLQIEGNTQAFKQLTKEFQFSGMDTCAVDGMCATDCPVSINTGELVKRLRRENHSALANRMAKTVARSFGIVEKMVKMALHAGTSANLLFGKNTMERFTRALKKPIKGFPLWTDQLTQPLDIKGLPVDAPDVVYFPSCITRMMGEDKEDPMPIHEVLALLCKRASLKLFIADHITGVCCGQLFSSKGFLPAYQYTVNKTIEKLWEWTHQGKVPVLMDVTSCTHSLQGSYQYLTEENKERFTKLTIIDSIDFAADYLIPRFPLIDKKGTIVFHPVCSISKMNLLPKLKAIGNACSVNPVIPFMSGCCGMAGDRGFYFPELTASATKAEAAEVAAIRETKDCYGYYSSGKTCEMALSEATKQNYQSVFYLLRAVSDNIPDPEKTAALFRSAKRK
ncbi:MAG: FAD-binding and (Fe-S)-binding domain-containing protein [Bacteroidota bacterium]